MIWLIGGGAAAALLMIAAGVWRLRRRPAGIDSVEDVAEAAEAALPGFRVAGAVVGADGQGALAVSEEGRVAVCRRRGRQLAVCEVAWSRVRATASGIMIDTGQRGFGSVTVAGVNALDVRRLSPLAARELMAAA